MASPFDELTERSRDLDARARNVQGQRALQSADDEIERLVDDYQAWYARALELLPEEFHERFRSEYEGSFWTSKIKHFFEAPGQPSAVATDEAIEQLGISYWSNPYETTFHGPLLQQRQILREAKQAVEGEGGFRTHLDLLERLARRFPDLLGVLASRHANRPAFAVEDEYDLQDLLHGVLTLHYDDVRAEDFASERAGARSRIDFVLKNEKIVLETKITRNGLGAKQVGDELIIDIERYRSHPDCAALLAIVYDPDRRIVNRRTLESDLSGTRDGLVVRVVVMH
jgi:hypothetical protein